jgi:peptide/nickel transport system permease protein
MWAYIVKRVLAGLVTALLCSIAIFLVIRAVPGDIVGQMLGQSGGAGSAVSEKALRAFFGLDQPLYSQYLDWLGGVLRGDFGRSWTQGRPVTGIVGDAFLVTLEIALATLVLATLIGVPLGLLAGIYEGRALDNLIQGFNILGLSAPVFWVGLMLLIGASAYLSWGPPIVYMPPGLSLEDNVAILALPVASLSLLQAAAYSQFVRQSVVSAAHQEFVRTAIAKGLPLRTVYFKHILRNILIPLVTFMGLILVQILGGVVVTESLFALPGIGRLLVTSIQARDYPVVQGALVLIVAIAIVVNLAVDLLYHVIDPRMRK